MTSTFPKTRLLAAGGLLLAGVALSAHGLRFSDFTPLAVSAGPTADESRPITLGNPEFEQLSIADRTSVLASNTPNTGSWDMNTVNETGRDKGRFLSPCSRPGSRACSATTCGTAPPTRCGRR